LAHDDGDARRVVIARVPRAAAAAGGAQRQARLAQQRAQRAEVRPEFEQRC
jgi:hypothetical protein